MADRDFTIQIYDDSGNVIKPENAPPTSKAEEKVGNPGAPTPNPPETQPLGNPGFGPTQSFGDTSEGYLGGSGFSDGRVTQAYTQPNQDDKILRTPSALQQAKADANLGAVTGEELAGKEGAGPGYLGIDDVVSGLEAASSQPQATKSQSGFNSILRKFGLGGLEEAFSAFSGGASSLSKVITPSTTTTAASSTSGGNAANAATTNTTAATGATAANLGTEVYAETASAAATQGTVGGAGGSAGASSFASVAGPLAAIAIALPIIADYTKKKRDQSEADRYQAKTGIGEFFQSNTSDQMRAAQDKPLPGDILGTNKIVTDIVTEPFTEAMITVTDTLAKVADGMSMLTEASITAATALADLALEVKPFTPAVATAQAFSRVNTKITEIERSRYLGPEAADTTIILSEINRELSHMTNTIAKPALSILNKMLSLGDDLIGPVLSRLADTIGAILSSVDKTLAFMKWAFDNSPGGKILNLMRDWRRENRGNTRRQLAAEQAAFFDQGIVNGFQQQAKPQPNNKGL